MTDSLHLSLEAAVETEALGAALATLLEVGDVVLLRGELGSGKTTLVRGACRALGVTGAVSSPTFTIGNRYTGRHTISHLDLYRFTGGSAAEWGDLEPYFDDALVFVEWPDQGLAMLPPSRLGVELSHDTPSTRRALVKSTDEALLQEITRALARLRHRDG